ncbi:leucine--tRNA ligase [Patescibacteria group bacterium]|nr:leucine--tRNA ligase [Patescibacteria group bacterium]
MTTYQDFLSNKGEKRWQDTWEKKKLFQASDKSDKEKFYALIEFPYPSGVGLHVGHPRPFTAMDVVSRKKRMQGYNVLYPIGFDAFGLPTENYAIKTGRPPAEVTKENVSTFIKQLKMLGFSFDWSRQVDTTDPKYFKWTQWIFLQLYKHGLAYKKAMPINWCLDCKIGLANEEVVDGKCERCGGEVEQRNKEQWMLAITKYADKLLSGLDTVDYIPQAKIQQQNWIGKSEGAGVNFNIQGEDVVLDVFTTRPDTLFGATYMVVSPEHALIEQLKHKITNYKEVVKYIQKAKKKSDLERTELQKDKTGVELNGIKAINPVNNEAISIWVADYVLISYGTGAIMAVPAHDERDWEFANKYNLEIRQVISGGSISKEAYTGDGKLINSDFLNGLNVEKAKDKINNWLEEKELGKKEVQYKLRDWIFSRQRYWGEPIPLVHCEKCQGWIPIPEDQLPLELPKVKKYEPTDTGESPLATVSDWVNTTCPKCGGPAKRETDTMPNWAGSSWYFLRYCDPHNDKELASKELLSKWMPIDWYNGGMEHTVLHLLYSRFWNQFLYDINVVPCSEPYTKRTSHGMILAKGGEKMSKSRGNVVNPDEIVDKYGADALRTYIMFMGPFDQAVEWDTNGLIGVRRFLDRMWNLQDRVGSKVNEDLETLLHQTIKKVGEDIDKMHFNTAIAQMMTFVNDATKQGEIDKEQYSTLVKILSPFAPHISEELWSLLGHTDSITYESWPEYDKKKIVENEITIVVQINGKLRGEMTVPADISEDDAKKQALKIANVVKWLDGKEPKKVIYVKGKLVSIVI